MTTDEFALYDAAYVLGALSPADRREFEAHLQGCPACASAVSELAGMEGETILPALRAAMEDHARRAWLRVVARA